MKHQNYLQIITLQTASKMIDAWVLEGGGCDNSGRGMKYKHPDREKHRAVIERSLRTLRQPHDSSKRALQQPLPQLAAT